MFLGNRLGTGRVRPLGGFSPSDISNQVLWLDASDSVSLGSPSADDPISSWGDLSVSGNNATQGTGVNQPLYKASGFGTNSKPYLDFDGSNDGLDLDSAIVSTGDFTMIQVVKKDAGIMLGVGSNVDTSAYSYLDFSDGKIYARNRSGYDTVTGGNSTSSIIGAVTFSGADIKLYKNGSLLTSAYTAGAQTTDYNSIGYRNGGYSNGRIAEILIYTKVLTSDELSSVNTYLNDKYGIY